MHGWNNMHSHRVITYDCTVLNCIIQPVPFHLTIILFSYQIDPLHWEQHSELLSLSLCNIIPYEGTEENEWQLALGWANRQLISGTTKLVIL